MNPNTKKIKTIPYFLFIILLLLPSFPIKAAVKGAKKSSETHVLAPEGSPTRAIQEMENEMDAYHVGDNLTPQQKEENSRLKKQILETTFDVAELCRLALGHHWKALSEGQRSHFVSLMKGLLETRALSAREQSKAAGKPYDVKYKGDEYIDGRRKAASRTVVDVPEKNVSIEINYFLKNGSNGWKIYDLEVDGAALVSNYANQFDKIIKQNGFSGLVARMEKKLKELEKKRAS
ncbi:MAG: ABC transporter substrate-binding protein [Deltaproteobacteria bacterium]|nr:ABC transporter substrate-binding protein [Deltaproteobacteria bacterium]